MKEIEVKILDIKQSEIEEKLERSGAIREFSQEMEAIFFDFPDKRIRNADEVLRLRREGEQAVFVYKKHLSKGLAKVMKELETAVADMNIMTEILQLLGMEIIAGTRKLRTQYQLGDTHIVIDEYRDELAFIPPFLEIEAPSISRIREVVQQLGFKQEDCRNWNTYDLVQHYKS